MTLESATSGKSGEFYYLLVDLAEPAGDIRRVFLYLANIEDGATISEIILNQPKGKIYEDDN
jgi:hypothetical protein